jgi:hypothetical protein
MAATPHTRDWKAWEDKQPPGPITLYVAGEVETSNSNQTPHLREAVPQGKNPTILILNLTITESGVGKAVMEWKPVRFERKLSREHYLSIDIHWEGKSIAACKVEVVH